MVGVGEGGGGSKVRKAADDLPLIVRQKLDDPEMELSPEQEIEYLKACIELGRRKAEAITAGCEDLLVFIGNSGSGKSTLVSNMKKMNFIQGSHRLEPPGPSTLSSTDLGHGYTVLVYPGAPG